MIKQALSLQKEFASKIGSNTTLQDVIMKTVRNYNEEILKACLVENQVIQTATDTAKQSIKLFNDNIKVITDLNKHGTTLMVICIHTGKKLV